MSEKSSHSPNSINTLIGPRMSVEGDVSCTGVLRVQGELHGDVSCSASLEGALVVDGEGRVNGSVRARHIEVRGRIVGPLQTAHSIEIHQGGTVTGNVLYKELAIHAGGAIEGAVKPLHLADGDEQAPRPSPVPQGKSHERRRGMRTAAIVSALAVAAVAGAWAWRSATVADRHAADNLTLKADTALRDNAPSEKPRDDAKTSPGDTLALAGGSPPAAMKEPTPSPERSEKFQTVRGINPSRPPGAFLLVTNEPVVLYRKKRDEPGDGARITVAERERASVSIAPDDVIRIAKGTDITMFYQGQKVPQQLIASGAWISFVAR